MLDSTSFRGSLAEGSKMRDPGNEVGVGPCSVVVRRTSLRVGGHFVMNLTRWHKQGAIIAHFRVPLSLCFRTILCAKPFL